MNGGGVGVTAGTVRRRGDRFRDKTSFAVFRRPLIARVVKW